MPSHHPPVAKSALQASCPHLRMTQKQTGAVLPTNDEAAVDPKEVERLERIKKDEEEGRLTTQGTVYEHVEGVDIDEF